MTAGLNPGLGEVAGERLGDLAGVDVAEGELNGLVAIGLDGADLSHDVGVDPDDGHGAQDPVLVPDLRHAELGAQQSLTALVLRSHGVAILRA